MGTSDHAAAVSEWPEVSDEYVLVTEGLTKEFAGFTAVRDVNLHVKPGSIHAPFVVGLLGIIIDTRAPLSCFQQPWSDLPDQSNRSSRRTLRSPTCTGRNQARSC